MPAKSIDRLDRDPQEWVSPAFLKRKKLSSTPFVNFIYDPFEYGHDYRGTSPSKRIKFGRKSGEWRFADQSPSPPAEADIGIVTDCGVPQKVVRQKAVVEDPPAIQAELQSHSGLTTKEKPPVAVIPSGSVVTYNEETAQSDERPSRKPNGDDSAVSDKSSEVPSSQNVLPNVDFESKERMLPIQDTYDQETVSESSPIADPGVELVTDILYGGKNAASENTSPAKHNSTLSPVQVQSSLDQASRSTSLFSDKLEMSEHNLTVQNSNTGSEIIQNELAGDEPFFKSAYVPSQAGDSFDISSEDEMVEILSDDAIDDQRHNDSSIYSTHKVNLPPTEFMPPSPSSFGHNYEYSGFSRARRHARSVSNSMNQADEMATAIAQNTSSNQIGASIGDSDDGLSSKELKIEDEIQGAGLEQVLIVPAIANTQPMVDAEEQLPKTPTRSALPLGECNKTKLSFSGNLDFIEDTAARQGQDVVHNLLDMSSERGATRENKLPVQEDHEIPQSDVDDQAKNNETCLSNDNNAPGQRVNVALSPKLTSIDNEETSKKNRVSVDGNALIESAESVSSDNRSGAEFVEIIDIDEYKAVELPEEKIDLAQSVEGDYWSDEELQYQSGLRSGSEDDEFSSGDERGSFANEYEDDDMRDEDDALVPNTFEQSGQSQYLRSDVKTPYIEIIDLESDDDIESTEPFGDDPNIPQASCAVPDIEGLSNTKAVLSLDGDDHRGAIELARQENWHQPQAGSDMVAPEHTQELVEPLSKPRGEVQDTYSEDAALSDTDSSEFLLATQVEGKTQFLQRFTEGSQDLSNVAQDLPASADLDIEVKGQQISKGKSQVQQGEGYSMILSDSSAHEEKIVIRGNNDLVEPMHSQDQDFSSPPLQYDELPDTQPSNTFEQTNNNMLIDDEAYDARTALNVNSIEHEQEMPKHNGNDLDEQGAVEYQSKALLDRFTMRSQLLTPNESQSTTVKPEPSSISKVSQDEHNTLLTPSLTQRTSDILAPITPMPRRPTLIEKLKEMRSISARKRQASLSDELLTGVSPWFGEVKSNHLRPLSDQESLPSAEEETGRDGDVSSEAEQSELDREPSLPIHRAVTPPLLSSVFTRLPSSSPPAHPEPEHGFRTSLSYFAPLSTLRSHYNSATSVLALVIASTVVSRAAAGPKDYHMTLYVTDPSSSSPPSVTSARIFRPSKFPFPEARQGDAILLRNFRVVSYRKQLGLLSTDSSAWAVFRRGEEPQIRGPPVEFGAEEMGFARGHWDWWGTVQQDKYINAVPEAKAQRQGREVRSGKGRSSIVRHELRDGTTYVDRPKLENTAMHELRDGTQWSDSKL